MVMAFRILGWLEGISFLLLLFVAVPIKYMHGDPQYVKMLGMPHGMLFLGYLLLSYYVGDLLSWNVKTRLLAVLAAVLPFGTFIFERKYLVHKS